jgi:hypothetical protein
MPECAEIALWPQILADPVNAKTNESRVFMRKELLIQSSMRFFKSGVKQARRQDIVGQAAYPYA